MSKLRTIEIAIIIGVIAAISLAGFNAFAAESSSIRAKTLRLHVLANSDSEEDQALKLRVRDKILESTGQLFSNQSSLDSAKYDAAASLAAIEAAALEEIRASGYDYTVAAKLENIYFTTRTYGEITLPAGNYDALRVEIGAAAGQNWWCVLYPPLCLPAAQGKTDTAAVFDAGERAVIEAEPKYEVRFWLLDWLGGR